eukprot:TRINITY_DN9477_c0_g1_i1.p1 TRINITY_DN9477_c0_g1~~TRINITY_DN9477_c0_g1_i1.p1  ORF type:complete len:319 (-),score=44.40 TRINITY_DN9477_c0_g1_i1:30-986(-)
MTNALTSTAGRILRWAPLLYTNCKLICIETTRERDSLKRIPPGFNWASSIANHTFIFLLVMTYCTITPIIVPFGLLYFGGSYFVDKHTLLFFGQPKEDLCGLMFPVAFNQLCATLCCYNLVMFGYFLGAGFGPGIAVTVLTTSGCILFWIYMSVKWENIGFYGSLEGITRTEMIYDETFKYEFLHPLLMPIPPEQREYESHEQCTWKQRGLTLAEVCLRGVGRKSSRTCSLSSLDDKVIEMKEQRACTSNKFQIHARSAQKKSRSSSSDDDIIEMKEQSFISKGSSQQNSECLVESHSEPSPNEFQIPTSLTKQNSWV